MYIVDVKCSDEVEEKLASKHGVNFSEVLEVFDNNPKFRFAQKGHREGENVYRALGQTYSGRYLTAFFIYKKTQVALVISARDMDSKERKNYDRK